MDPVIQEFAATFRDVEFVKIDVDELMVWSLSPFHFNSLGSNFKNHTLQNSIMDHMC